MLRFTWFIWRFLKRNKKTWFDIKNSYKSIFQQLKNLIWIISVWIGMNFFWELFHTWLLFIYLYIIFEPIEIKPEIKTWLKIESELNVHSKLSPYRKLTQNRVWIEISVEFKSESKNQLKSSLNRNIILKNREFSR